MIGCGHFQVTGLGSRVPGSGVLVRVQVQDLHFVPHPHLYLITLTRDLKMPLTLALPPHRGRDV